MGELENRTRALADGTAPDPPSIDELQRRSRRRTARRTTGAAASCLIAIVITLGLVSRTDNPGQSVTDRRNATTTLPGKTTTTAKMLVQPGGAAVDEKCRNSYDPACGEFRWASDPGSNAPIAHQLVISNQHPQAGETITIRVIADDPDAPLTDDSLSFYVSGIDDLPIQTPECPENRTRYGVWDVPAKQAGHLDKTFTYTIPQATGYSVVFTVRSDRCAQTPTGSDGFSNSTINPYASYSSHVGAAMWDENHPDEAFVA